MTAFKELGLNNEIMKSLDDLGFVEPSPVQAKAIPFILESKKDLIALAQTGTGKTAAYGLPVLNQIKDNEKELVSIILCPTRELCLQIADDMKKYAKYTKHISITPVYGGERIDFQIKALRRGTNIVVGTPGRVHDLIRRKVLKLQNIKWLVLDEADEMLDMGFKDDLDAILSQTPKERQTLLFSATMSRSVYRIASQYMTEAQEINVGEKNIGAANVSHEYYVVQARDRFEALKRILDSLPGIYGILFCRTRRETQEVASKLKQANYDAEALNGELSQATRTKIMDSFKKKQIRLLVATDVAARGIDVNNLSHVINYNLPDQNEGYTHRSGRTGRANNKGVSIAIVHSREVNKIQRLEKIIGKKFERKQVPNRDDIFKKQIDSFVKEIEETNIEEMSKDEHFLEIVDKLKKTKKEDLIKHFIAYKFNHLMGSNQNNRDLNAQSNSPRDRGERNFNDDGPTLKINLGKRDGFGIKDLFQLINSNKNLKGLEIGSISLMSECSTFSVDSNRVEAVIRGLTGVTFAGTKINITRSGDSGGNGRSNGYRSDSGGRSGRGRSGRGGNRSRSGGSSRRRGSDRKRGSRKAR